MLDAGSDPPWEDTILRGGHAPTSPITFCHELCNKSSAVVEMGDRFATIDMGRKVEGCCALFRGGLDLHATQCRLAEAIPPYQVVS